MKLLLNRLNWESLLKHGKGDEFMAERRLDWCLLCEEKEDWRIFKVYQGLKKGEQLNEVKGVDEEVQVVIMRKGLSWAELDF